MNTLKGMAFHPRTGAPWLGGGSGGVSGPAIRAIALEQVAAVSRRVRIPVIGMGGIQSRPRRRRFHARRRELRRGRHGELPRSRRGRASRG